MSLEGINDLIGQSIEAEQALLGALLVAPDRFLVAQGIMRPEYFSDPTHAAVWNAIDECRRSGRKGSGPEIRQALGSSLDHVLNDNGLTLSGYIAEIARNASGLDAASCATTARTLWALRQLERVTTDPGVGLAENRLKEAFDAVDAVRAAVEERALSRAFIGEIGIEVLTRAAKIAAGIEKQSGITTGIPALDEAMGGFGPGELVVFAGRPGMGKTITATSFGLACSKTDEEGRFGAAGMFALELGREAVGARCLADLASHLRYAPTYSAIRKGLLNQAEEETLTRAAERLEKRAFQIDGRSTATIGEIEAACKAMNREFEKKGRRLNVIFIDYLDQIRASERYRGNRTYEIGEITYGLREMAKRMQLCVVLLVQLNRDVEKRDVKRPSLADLRSSGNIEQDADVVALLYRPAYYLAEQARTEPDPVKQSALYQELSQVENQLEIILAKNRNGAGQQTIKVKCDVARSAIRPLDVTPAMERSNEQPSLV